MIFTLLLASTLFTTDADRQDAYESMLSCAAFHTIEATRAEDGSGEAQQAAAYDFAGAAASLAADGNVETANADLATLLASYREKLDAGLDSGNVREMAEDWTALESACRDLHPLKERVMQKPAPADPEQAR